METKFRPSETGNILRIGCGLSRSTQENSGQQVEMRRCCNVSCFPINSGRVKPWFKYLRNQTGGTSESVIKCYLFRDKVIHGIEIVNNINILNSDYTAAWNVENTGVALYNRCLQVVILLVPQKKRP